MRGGHPRRAGGRRGPFPRLHRRRPWQEPEPRGNGERPRRPHFRRGERPRRLKAPPGPPTSPAPGSYGVRELLQRKPGPAVSIPTYLTLDKTPRAAGTGRYDPNLSHISPGGFSKIWAISCKRFMLASRSPKGFKNPFGLPGGNYKSSLTPPPSPLWGPKNLKISFFTPRDP